VPRPAVVHLIGYPASGKLTVAKALVAAAAEVGRTFVLLDNHLTADAILSVIDRSIHPIPATVWDRVDDVRDIVYDAIVDLSPADWSFVITNVVRDDDPREARTVTRVRRLAEERSSHHVPVRVRCDRDVLLTRVTAPDRRTRHKWTDPEGVARYVEANEMFDLSPYDPFDLDTTAQTPESSAAAILTFIEKRDAIGGV
jgi:adenylate kinase family enzyme